MDEKGANTFPFHNLPPGPTKYLKRFLLCFFQPFLQDKIKSRWRLLLNRTSANTNAKHQSVLPPYHRTGDSAGEKLKSGVTLGFRSPLFSIDCFVCFYICGLCIGVSQILTRIWGKPFLGSIICEGPVRGIPTWVKQWLRWCGALVCTDIPRVETGRIWVFQGVIKHQPTLEP